MMRQIGGSVFGIQVGQAIGALAGEVVGGTDVGLPLVAAGAVALLPANVAAFGEGLDVPADEVRLYLAPARGRPPPAVRPRAVAAARTCSAPSRPTPAASRIDTDAHRVGDARDRPAATRRRCSRP